MYHPVVRASLEEELPLLHLLNEQGVIEWLAMVERHAEFREGCYMNKRHCWLNAAMVFLWVAGKRRVAGAYAVHD